MLSQFEPGSFAPIQRPAQYTCARPALPPHPGPGEKRRTLPSSSGSEASCQPSCRRSAATLLATALSKTRLTSSDSRIAAFRHCVDSVLILTLQFLKSAQKALAVGSAWTAITKKRYGISGIRRVYKAIGHREIDFMRGKFNSAQS